jgi:hypothetical protein
MLRPARTVARHPSRIDLQTGLGVGRWATSPPNSDRETSRVKERARATSQINAVSALMSARADRWRGSSTVHALGCVRDHADPLAATASDLIHLVRPGQGCSSSIRPSGTCAPEDRRNQTALADQPRLKSCDSDGRAADRSGDAVRAISSTSWRATTRHPGRRLDRVGWRQKCGLRPACRAVGRCQAEEMTLRFGLPLVEVTTASRQQMGVTTPATSQHAPVLRITTRTVNRPDGRGTRVRPGDFTGAEDQRQ